MGAGGMRGVTRSANGTRCITRSVRRGKCGVGDVGSVIMIGPSNGIYFLSKSLHIELMEPMSSASSLLRKGR